jgi:hypothetical protein
MTNYFVSVKQRPHRQRCVLDDRLREISKSNRFSISEVLIRVGYACVFIWLSDHTCISTCVFLKKGGNLIVVQQYYKWELVL